MNGDATHGLADLSRINVETADDRRAATQEVLGQAASCLAGTPKEDAFLVAQWPGEEVMSLTGQEPFHGVA